VARGVGVLGSRGRGRRGEERREGKRKKGGKRKKKRKEKGRKGKERKKERGIGKEKKRERGEGVPAPVAAATAAGRPRARGDSRAARGAPAQNAAGDRVRVGHACSAFARCARKRVAPALFAESGLV
jgi:hypothetical protein